MIAAKSSSKSLHRSWLVWLVGLVLLGPVAWVLLYRFVDPPLTLPMVLGSDRPVIQHWVPLARISPYLIDSVIASEDAHFCSHHGFDRSAIREAWKSNEKGRRLRGASTISMQTAKNAFLWSDRTWLRKGAEAYFTFLIELFWPKARIMEVYLNIAQWGDGLYGAEAAARHEFNVSALALEPEQAAALAAVLPNPLHWSSRSGAAFMHDRIASIEARAGDVKESQLDACVKVRR